MILVCWGNVHVLEIWIVPAGRRTVTQGGPWVEGKVHGFDRHVVDVMPRASITCQFEYSMFVAVLVRTALSWPQKSSPLFDEKFAASMNANEFIGPELYTAF